MYSFLPLTKAAAQLESASASSVCVAEMFRLLISLWSIFTSLLVCSRAVGLGNLSILLIVSDSARFNTSGAAIGFDLALNRINREPSLLSGYDLTVSSIVDDKVCYFLNS